MSIKCPACDCDDTAITDAIMSSLNEKYRRRVCPKCGFIFYTCEFIVEENESFKKEWRYLVSKDVEKRALARAMANGLNPVEVRDDKN